MAKIFGFGDFEKTDSSVKDTSGLLVSKKTIGNAGKAKVFGFGSQGSVDNKISSGDSRGAGKAQVVEFKDLMAGETRKSNSTEKVAAEHDQDYLLALKLQAADLQGDLEEWKAEEDDEADIMTKFDTGKKHQSIVSPRAENLTDPEFDLIDPCPDIHALFIEYDKKYFWGRLGSVILEWSKRMTICAGIFYLRGGGTIRLSQPLLQYRPRKNLVETLLHEMIHAYLYLTRNFKDRDGHGDEFKSHMNRINALANTQITIYHTFHDEVAACRQHVWRCTGTCRTMAPFFGYVKRSMNRAPGKNDRWWPDHQAKCQGTFEKVAEPDSFKVKQAKKADSEAKKALKVSQSTQADSTTDAKKIAKSKSNVKKDISSGNTTSIVAFFKPKAAPKTEPTANYLATKRKSDELEASPNQKAATNSNESDLQIIQVCEASKKAKSVITEDQVIVLDDGDMPSESCKQAECPVCGFSFPIDLINSHVNSHF